MRLLNFLNYDIKRLSFYQDASHSSIKAQPQFWMASSSPFKILSESAPPILVLSFIALNRKFTDRSSLKRRFLVTKFHLLMMF